MTRPPIPDLPLPDGFAWAVLPVPGWEVGNPLGYACRAGAGNGRKACGRPAVATAERGGRTRRWAYCADHLYGSWIEDGKVVNWLPIEAR